MRVASDMAMASAGRRDCLAARAAAGMMLGCGQHTRGLTGAQRIDGDSVVTPSDLSCLTKMVSITNLVNSLQVRASFAVLKWRAFLAPQIGEIARAAPMRDFVCSRILNSLR